MSAGQAVIAYTFMTKKEIVARIGTDPAFAKECFEVMVRRTAARVKGAQRSQGFMASHRAAADALKKAIERGQLTSVDAARLVALLSRYAKQLAAHFRAMHIARFPESFATAVLFSAAPPALSGIADHTNDARRSSGSAASGAPRPQEAAAREPQEAGRRRPGRPKGSRNRPKDERTTRGRRAS